MVKIDIDMPTECLRCPFSYKPEHSKWKYGNDEVISYRCMVNMKLARICADGVITKGKNQMYIYKPFKMKDCPLIEVKGE